MTNIYCMLDGSFVMSYMGEKQNAAQGRWNWVVYAVASGGRDGPHCHRALPAHHARIRPALDNGNRTVAIFYSFKMLVFCSLTQVVWL